MNNNLEIPKYSLHVEWSEEDQIWIGRSPELFGGGVHGNDRDAVLEELRQAVEEVIENARKTGIPFPGPLPAEVHAS